MVLDTNVCLDLLLFRDPTVAVLAAALQAGELVAVTDADCRAEWQRVLGYPQLALAESVRSRLLAEYDHGFRLQAPPPAAGLAPLPRCADPDDQKFLQLAQYSGARWLISRDRALLELSRRVQRDHGFAILTPQQWPASLVGAT